MLKYFIASAFSIVSAATFAQESTSSELWLGDKMIRDTMTCAELRALRNPTLWVGSDVEIDYSFVVSHFRVSAFKEDYYNTFACSGEPSVLWEEEWAPLIEFDDDGEPIGGPLWRKPVGMYSNLSTQAIKCLMQCPTLVLFESVVARRHSDQMDFEIPKASFVISN